MKPKLFLLFILLSTSISGQNKKGKFFIETCTKLFGGGDYLHFIGETGISLNQTHGYYRNEWPTTVHEYSYNVFSYSIAPRVGFYLNKKTIVGMEIQQIRANYHDEFQKYRNTSAGLFFRYIFIERKVSPFIEGALGIGESMGLSDEVSPGGGQWQKNHYKNLYYYSASSGVSFILNSTFRFNLFAKIQNTIEKPSNRGNVSSSTFKESKKELGPMLSVSYIFNKKSKEK